MADKKLDELVKTIQTYLVSKGDKLNVDGDMGLKTYNAIVRRQKKTAIHPITARQDWRNAHAIVILLNQINIAYPSRDKSGDGTIGDAAHAKRKSDHNAWVRDKNGQPVVTALDITHDPAHGVDCAKIAEAIRHDPRVKYVIFAGRIFNPTVSSEWRPYTSGDPHNHHFHLSVSEKESLFDSNAPWRIS